MLVGDRFEKDGKQYEVTELLPNGNFAFKKAEPKPIKAAEPKPEEEIKEVKAGRRGKKG